MSGLAVKMHTFENILFQICHHIVPVELPKDDTDAAGWSAASSVHESLVSLAALTHGMCERQAVLRTIEFLQQTQNQLARSFPFISHIEVTTPRATGL